MLDVDIIDASIHHYSSYKLYLPFKMHACIIQPITFTCISFDVLTYIMYNMHRSFVSYVVFFQPP